MSLVEYLRSSSSTLGTNKSRALKMSLSNGELTSGKKLAAAGLGPSDTGEDVLHVGLRLDAPRAAMKILVADDCEDTAYTMTVLLQSSGYDVRSAANGEEAVSLALRMRPHAALLNIMMPRLSGFDAAAQIRALLPSTMLIAISGLPKLATRPEKLARFDHYLIKPIDLYQLLALLAKRSEKNGEGRA